MKPFQTLVLSVLVFGAVQETLPQEPRLYSPESVRLVARALRFVAQSELAFVSSDTLVGPIAPYSPPDEASRKVKPGEPIYLTELTGDEALTLYKKMLASPGLFGFAGIEERSLTSGKLIVFFNREPQMPHRIYTVAVSLSMMKSEVYPKSIVSARPRKLSDTLRDAVRKYLTRYPAADVDPAPPPRGSSRKDKLSPDPEAPLP